MRLDKLSTGIDGERKVRAEIEMSDGVIRVFEPTLEQAQEIIDLTQEIAGNDFSAEEVYFDELTVVNRLFPMLTDIEAQHLSNAQILEILENPTVQLMTVLQVIGQIVSESNRLYTERLVTQLAHVANAQAQNKLINELPKAIQSAVMASGNDELIKDYENIQLLESKLYERADSNIEETNEEFVRGAYQDMKDSLDADKVVEKLENETEVIPFPTKE